MGILFVVFLFCLVFWLGVKFLNRLEHNFETKKSGELTHFQMLSQWGYGIALIWVVLFFIFYVSLWAIEFIAEILMPIVLLVMPLVLYVFTGIVHFSTIKMYKSNQLDYHEEKIYKISGVAFYVVTALLIWVVVFMIRVFTGEISLM